MGNFPFSLADVFDPLASLRENELYQKSVWAEIPALKLRMQQPGGLYFGENARRRGMRSVKLSQDKRDYKEFEILYDSLNERQKERTEEIVRDFTGAAVRMLEPGLLHNGKMHDRDVWDYYIEYGSAPADLQFPRYKWMDSLADTKEARFRQVLNHLRDPGSSELAADTPVRPASWQKIPWKFDDVDTVCIPDKHAFALPYPHELSADSSVYALRTALREEIRRTDDTSVIQAVMSHPDIRDVVQVCEYYSGLCDGEQERYYSARATQAINKVADRIIAGELAGFPNGTEQLNLLTEQMRAMSDALREKYFGLGRDFDMHRIGKEAMAKAAEALRKNTQPSLSKTERLALLAGLLGKYSSIGGYVDYGMRETALIEKWSRRDGAKDPGYRFDDGKWMVFTGIGSLPISAIMEHIITGTPCLLVDVEEHALLKAQNIISALERFGIVEPGRILCAPPCSAEEFFSLSPPFTRVTNDDEGNRRRLLEHRQWLEKIGAVHMAALISDMGKYDVAQAIGKLPAALQPELLLSRTAFGKSMLAHPKTLRYPICRVMPYAGSSAARIAGDAPEYMSDESRRMLDVLGADEPAAAISSAHIFLKQGDGKRRLPIVAAPGPDTWSNAIDGEIDLDPSFRAVIGRERLGKLRECTRRTSMFPLHVHMNGNLPRIQPDPWWKTHHNLAGILGDGKPQAYTPMPAQTRYPLQLNVLGVTHG